jgi:hypothetical protein
LGNEKHFWCGMINISQYMSICVHIYVYGVCGGDRSSVRQ